MAKEKIFDIIPPKKLKIKEILKKKPKKDFIFSKEILFALISVFILIFFLSNFLIKSKTEIEILSPSELKNFETSLEIDIKNKESDFTRNIIPGEIIEADGFASQEFSSSGKILKEEKAQGIIRVYNNYSTVLQPLVATTRFVSAEGKLFRTPKGIVVPGAYYDDEEKLVPGWIDIEVIADESGPEYNIGPSTFSIPGFAGTKRYYSFYARSFSSITGGKIKEVSQVTEEDLKEAERILSEMALKESEISLENKISSDLIILNDAKENEILETVPLATIGQEVENFVFQVRAKTKSFVFNKNILENFVKFFLLDQLPENKEFQNESLDIKYSLKTIDFQKEKFVLKLNISAKVYSSIDEKRIKEIIKGKDFSQVQEELLENYPEILKTKVKFWPFWMKSFPEEEEKIKVLQRVD